MRPTRAPTGWQEVPATALSLGVAMSMLLIMAAAMCGASTKRLVLLGLVGLAPGRHLLGFALFYSACGFSRQVAGALLPELALERSVTGTREVARPDKPGCVKHVEYHRDGSVRARGWKRGGKLDGWWDWFRLDGTRLRSGSFNTDRQVGEWTTYDRKGRPYKVTLMQPGAVGCRPKRTSAQRASPSRCARPD